MTAVRKKIHKDVYFGEISVKRDDLWSRIEKHIKDAQIDSISLFCRKACEMYLDAWESGSKKISHKKVVEANKKSVQALAKKIEDRMQIRKTKNGPYDFIIELSNVKIDERILIRCGNFERDKAGKVIKVMKEVEITKKKEGYRRYDVR